MKVFLIGMPGSGKTTLGAQLALELGVRFIELDHEISEDQGLPITDIFIQKGEKIFRLLESKLLRELSKGNPNGFVMSCGGGTPCFGGNMKFINQAGLSVFINVSYGQLAKRLENSNVRPLLNDLDRTNLAAALEKKFGDRIQIYKTAQLEIEDDDLTISKLLLRVRDSG